MRNVLLLSFLCAGCTFSVRGLSVGDDGGGVDGGGEDGPTSCDPGGSQNHCSADGTAILACAPDGTTFNPQPCNFGCAGPTGAPHCALLVPSGVVLTTDYRMPSAQMITISSDTVFHVDDGSITGGVTRAAG
ncbi:MAG TPA: hypothetical protein VFF06_21180, partial [Polyangia bacterium]|nr:hypothetical protein [Polyangia bacterium]